MINAFSFYKSLSCDSSKILFSLTELSIIILLFRVCFIEYVSFHQDPFQIVHLYSFHPFFRPGRARNALALWTGKSFAYPNTRVWCALDVRRSGGFGTATAAPPSSKDCSVSRNSAHWVKRLWNRRIQFINIRFFPLSSRVNEWASERTNERSGAN